MSKQIFVALASIGVGGLMALGALGVSLGHGQSHAIGWLSAAGLSFGLGIGGAVYALSKRPVAILIGALAGLAIMSAVEWSIHH